ncbi:hypothetical protein C2E25_13475 [Geothermobacter hydrogeniphilus]|uniref:diguanylate cyclase n=1 Tax=Geothermobacter hydrogeniphilus TaxID=1969733 RepID=A0A2K2H7I2_9BACT|nr:GGDEF domain-containing protein [Geothermobacter hydrogeniphilus]PNU19217.1 hypothetical protein C2E25_13475 [Geothermobacter hydrogeniphilus]
MTNSDTITAPFSPEQRLLETARVFSACRGHGELFAALGRLLPGFCHGRSWQLWLRDQLTGDWRPADGSAANLQQAAEPLSTLVKAVADSGEPRDAPEAPASCNYWLPLPGVAEIIGVLGVECGAPADPEVVTCLAMLGELLGNTLELMLLLEQLQKQNITDELTGLYNARHFRELVDYELERARRYGNDLSLVFLDLDFFKKVNDAHGHLVGSRLLTEVGHFIMQHTRRVNLACRYGGDEFVLLLPSTSKSGALTMAEILRLDLRSQRFEAGAPTPITITASFGVASYPDDARNARDLIHLADEAMYRVKGSGRDGVAGS